MLWAVGGRPGRGHAVLLSLTPQPLVRMPPSGFPAPCCGNTPASALSAAQYFASTMIIVGLSVVVTVIVLQYHHHDPDGGKMPKWVSSSPATPPEEGSGCLPQRGLRG